MNMYKWLEAVRNNPKKKPMPVLSYPAIQMTGVNVRELSFSAEAQARGMKLVADRTDALASDSLMDLSVEAECFGSQVRMTEDEVPTVVGAIVTTPEEAEALQVPAVGSGRTGIYLDAIAEAKKLITDRPVFAGVIGPFSLAGRLVDVTEAMTTRYSWSERRRGRQAPIRPHRAARPKRAPPKVSPCTFRRCRFRRNAWGYGFRAWKRGVPDSSPVPPRTQPSFHPSEP